MISINKKILENIIVSEKVEIDKKISFRKRKLKKHLYFQPSIIPLSFCERSYLELLLEEYENIMIASPQQLKGYVIKFNNIIDFNEMAEKHKKFKDLLVKYMGYSTLRNSFYPSFFNKIGIKVCVYCNSLLAVSVRSSKGKKVARFEIDHYLPKSSYPCFSTSFFNLYPSCGECNGRKSNNLVEFNLYSNDYNEINKSNFSFEIDKKSLIKYKVNGVQEKLKINFNEPLGAGFNDSFAIEGIYSTQLDLAEELVIKSMIYTDSYKSSLLTSFNKLYKNKKDISNRLILGNYTDVKDIHKRPMAKFTQDIARQLELI